MAPFDLFVKGLSAFAEHVRIWGSKVDQIAIMADRPLELQPFRVGLPFFDALAGQRRTLPLPDSYGHGRPSDHHGRRDPLKLSYAGARMIR